MSWRILKSYGQDNYEDVLAPAGFTRIIGTRSTDNPYEGSWSLKRSSAGTNLGIFRNNGITHGWADRIDYSSTIQYEDYFQVFGGGMKTGIAVKGAFRNDGIYYIYLYVTTGVYGTDFTYYPSNTGFFNHPYVELRMEMSHNGGNVGNVRYRVTNAAGTAYILNVDDNYLDTTGNAWALFYLQFTPTRLYMWIDTQANPLGYEYKSGDFTATFEAIFGDDEYDATNLEITRELDGIGSASFIIEEKDIDFSAYDSLQESEFSIVDPDAIVKFYGMIVNPILLGKNTIKIEAKEITQQLVERTCKRDYVLEKGVLTDVEDVAGTYYMYDESKSWAVNEWNGSGVLTFPTPVPKYPIAFATCSNTKPISLVSTTFGQGRGLAKTATSGTFDQGMDDLTGTYDVPVVQANIMTEAGIWRFGIKPGSVGSQLEVLRTDASTSLPLECVRITCESRIDIGKDGFPIMDMYIDMSGIPTGDIVGLIFHVQGAVRDGTRQPNGISVFVMDYNVGTDNGKGQWEELTGASTRITAVAIPDGYGGEDPGIWGLYEETFELSTGSEGFSKLAQSSWADYIYTWKEWKVWPDYSQSYVADHKVLRLCIVGRDNVDYDSSNYCGIHIGAAYVTVIRSGTDTNQYTIEDTLAPSKIEVTPNPTALVGAGDRYVFCPSTKQVFDDFDNATYGASDYSFLFSDTLSPTDFIPTNFLGDTHYNTLKFISDYSKARWWLNSLKVFIWGDESDISNSGVTLDDSNLDPKHTTLSFPQPFIIKKCIVRGNPSLGLVYTATSASSDATREEVINLPHATYYQELKAIGDAVIDRYGAKKPFIETVMDYAAPEVPDMEIGTYVTCNYSTLSSEEMKVQRYTISWKAGDKARIVFNLGDPKSPDPFKKRDVLNKILERVYRLEVNPSGIDWADRTYSLIQRTGGIGSGEVGNYLSSDGSTDLSGDWDAGSFYIQAKTLRIDNDEDYYFEFTGTPADSSKTWTFQNATDVVVGRDTTDTLTNKTLTTPVLATPDINAGTVDAITSLTVANNVDIGGFTLQALGFISDIAIGTAPLTVTSTTVVTNLNADLWDGYQFADYLDQSVKIDTNVKFQQITINNQGAGVDPVISSNSASQVLNLAGGILVSNDLQCNKDLYIKSNTTFWGVFIHTLTAQRTYTLPDITGTVITSANPTDLDHDALTNFVAAKHIDWTGASDNFQTSGILDAGALTATSFGGITSANLVDKSASETIGGEWTYSIFPITPSAAPDANYEVANKKYVDDEISGAGLKTDLDSLDDVTITGVVTGDILYYSGAAWVDLARGTDGQVLTSTAASINWEAVGAADNLGNHTATENLNLVGFSLIGTGYSLGTVELGWLEDIYDTGVTVAEFDYLDGVISNIQTQFTGKAASSHAMSTHSDETTYNISTSGTYAFGAAAEDLNLGGFDLYGVVEIRGSPDADHRIVFNPTANSMYLYPNDTAGQNFFAFWSNGTDNQNPAFYSSSAGEGLIGLSSNYWYQIYVNRLKLGSGAIIDDIDTAMAASPADDQLLTAQAIKEYVNSQVRSVPSFVPFIGNGTFWNAFFCQPVLQMPSADNDCYFRVNLKIPDDWVDGNCTLKIMYSQDGANVYSVTWYITGLEATDNWVTEAYNILNASTAYDYAAGTANIIYVKSIALSDANIKAGGSLGVFCKSDANNTDELYIMEVWIEQ